MASCSCSREREQLACRVVSLGEVPLDHVEGGEAAQGGVAPSCVADDLGLLQDLAHPPFRVGGEAAGRDSCAHDAQMQRVFETSPVRSRWLPGQGAEQVLAESDRGGVVAPSLVEAPKWFEQLVKSRDLTECCIQWSQAVRQVAELVLHRRQSDRALPFVEGSLQLHRALGVVLGVRAPDWLREHRPRRPAAPRRSR